MNTMHLYKGRLSQVLVCEDCGIWLKMGSLEKRGDNVTKTKLLKVLKS